MQSIALKKKRFFSMDARVKPAHDESWILGTGMSSTSGQFRPRAGGRNCESGQTKNALEKCS
jgi:hypothetical protein